MSGYDIEKFDPPPDPDLVCCICQCVLDKAVECPCRHVFCQSCIERWLTNRHTCPTCRKRTRKQDLKPVLPLVQNMLNRLLMICDYRDNGCLEKIMLEHFERHVKNCGYEMKTCRFSKCGIRILRMHLEKHENDECEHRETACDGECGLMIALSDRPTHNCVAALKAHIDEKNRMIEQLKVKLHELNNLSQSLNDQLVELRQQLNDRNHIFSSDSSDSSESDVTDFMSDDLSRDSFRDSWFDSAASNISADNMDNASNNDANQDNNNNAGNAEGSDVVEQVERTVVNSLFELSSRLERVRNQMRAVLNSRLVQDQNNLNDDVRIPSAAELDAIVNSNSNENNNTATVTSATNAANNHSNNGNDDDRRNENGQNGDHGNSDNDARYYTDDENRSNDRYSYANDSRWSNLTEENRPANTAGSDVSDLNWISDSDSNHTPYNHSPNTSVHSPEYERYTPFRNESRNFNNQYISEHVILSQPPDSPSDTTGSFSSIPSSSSAVNSPAREQDSDDSMHGSFFTATPATNHHSSPAHSHRSYFNPTDHSGSPVSSSPQSPDSCRNDEVSDHPSTNFSNSSPAHSVSSLASASEGNSSKSEASHYSSDENDSSSCNQDDKSDTSAKSSPRSHCSNSLESEADDTGNVETSQNERKVENKSGCYETSYVDSSLDYEHGESHEESQNNDHLPESSAEELSHTEDQEESDCARDTDHEDKTNAAKDNLVSRCEPDSTQSPSSIQQHQFFSSVDGLSASNPLMISTATDTTDSDNSESMKYLTKRIRRSERSAEKDSSTDVNTAERSIVLNESTDPGSTVDSGFVTGSSSPANVVSQPSSNSKKNSGRKRKHASINLESDEHKKSKLSGDSQRNNIDQTSHSCPSRDTNTASETVTNNSSSISRYGFRKRSHDNDFNSVNDSKKNKAGGVTSLHSNAQTNSHRSRTSPPRNRQSWREASQHLRRNRAGGNRRSNQSSVNDNNGQSLNVKIDLSLINYSGRLVSESTSATIPTATVVHSANISPMTTASSAKREMGLTTSRQNISDSVIKSSTPKQDDATYRNNHRQRTSRSQRHESLCSTWNANTNTSPARSTNNISNTSNRDFPNSWRDSSDSSSDNTWEPGSECDDMDDSSTEGDDGFETESSYEVQIPKSTAALLEEYASDESDESWTVGMN